MTISKGSIITSPTSQKAANDSPLEKGMPNKTLSQSFSPSSNDHKAISSYPTSSKTLILSDNIEYNIV